MNKTAVKPKKTTAEEKAYKAIQTWDARLKHDNAALTRAFSKAISYNQQIPKHPQEKAKLLRKRDNCLKIVDASKKRKSRDKKQLKAAKDRYNRIHQQRVDISDKLRQIDEHNAGWNNEGKCAIFRSDGKGEVIYISPSDTESENVSSNITSYPVDEGAPYQDYARVSSKGATVAGIITGKDRADADRKWYMLRKWNSQHIRLTYKGDFYYKHYLISSMTSDHKTFQDNLEVSINFQFVYEAKITTANDSKHHRKSSKSSKSVAGNRNKKYTAITIKSGDTLWALSKKYGKSVNWIAKVNKIKNPNLIIAGKKIRVR